MLLVATVRRDLPLTAFHRDRLASIDAHDFSGVRRLAAKHFVEIGKPVDDEYLDAGILALKQYYAIALLDGRNMHAVSDKVDPFWHAHMLHSKAYTKFCDEVVGGFMHHDPLDHASAKHVEFVGDLYHFTLKRYATCFLHVDPRFNPANPPASELVCTHGNDIYAVAQQSLFPKESFAQEPAWWND